MPNYVILLLNMTFQFIGWIGLKKTIPMTQKWWISKVFFEWWGRNPLNVGKKLQLIQVAFEYMGKLAMFNKILGKYPDLDMLFEYAKSNTTPALTGGDGVIWLNKTCVLDNADMIGLEFIRTGQITSAEYEVICRLSMVIRSEADYMSICDSLGAPLEYGPQTTPRYGTWMLQMEATLMKFYSKYTSLLYKMAHVRTAFNACDYLMFWDETLVSMGHRISVINDYAGVHNPPNARSSADSSLDLGKKGERFP